MFENLDIILPRDALKLFISDFQYHEKNLDQGIRRAKKRGKDGIISKDFMLVLYLLKKPNCIKIGSHTMAIGFTENDVSSQATFGEVDFY